MPLSLIFPIALRAAGPVAFIISAMAAGAMNQSVMLVPILALTATLTTLLIRKVSPSPAGELAAALNPQAEQKRKSVFKGALKRFGAGLIGYAVCFGIAALIAAMFQETEFNQLFVRSDIWFALIPAIIAIVGAYFSSRMAFGQMADVAGQMQTMFAQMQDRGHPAGTPEDDDFTLEGEIVEDDNKPPSEH
ncbi:MAG: hypothetical protein AAF296_12340 [Pseudomonadota bacterium]